MNTEMKLNTDCKTCRTHLPDLLLDEGYAASHPELEAHLESCTTCRTELTELRSTFALLDEFAAPEPSPYFDTRLHARLREAQAAEPESLWERTRAFFLYSTGRSFRPLAVSALALVLVVGGGSAFLPGHLHQPAVTANAASATVDDLKVLDNNAQAEQQMGQLLDTSGSEDGDTPPTS
jgi:anti-sigma factor RsiW